MISPEHHSNVSRAHPSVGHRMTAAAHPDRLEIYKRQEGRSHYQGVACMVDLIVF